MLTLIGDTLTDLAGSEDQQDREDEDDDEEDTGHGKLSKDDEPGSVMGTISNMGQHCMESFRQKQMRLDEPTQWGGGNGADYFHEGDMKYRTTELKVPAVVKLQTDLTAATPSTATLEELMQAFNIVPRKSQMWQVPSGQGSSQMRLSLVKPQSDNHIVPPMRTVVPDLSQTETSNPIQPVSFYNCI